MISPRVRGLEALQRHVPAWRTPTGFLSVPLSIAVVAVLTSLFFLAVDRYFAEWLPDGEIVILALGFLILSRFFSQRKRYLQRYGERAYSVAFTRFFITGIGIFVASVAHLSYIAGPEIPEVWWKPWLVGLGYVLIISAILLLLRVMQSVGLDSLLMLYVYYPQEGARFNAPVYSLLRHPIYAAAQDIAFGLALIHSNWYALLVALLLPLFFAGWTRLFEEPDLSERFPEYAEYRKRVPAFAPAPSSLGKLWRLMLTGKCKRRIRPRTQRICESNYRR